MFSILSETKSLVSRVLNNILVKRRFCYVTVQKKLSCKLLVIGGGSGGCSVAARFVRKLEKDSIIILEPCDTHMYQSMMTLIGAGVYKIDNMLRPMRDVLPAKARWVRDTVTSFDPDSNIVYTKGGIAISYNYLVISTGVQLRFHDVEGLEEALNMENSGVCSNYYPVYAERTYKTLQNFKEGNAVFTFPNTAVKCGGAPLKICFLSENYFEINKKRSKANVLYKTPHDFLFIAKYYAEPLLQICKDRNINIGYKQLLVQVKPEKKEAVFRIIGKTYEFETVPYEMLHVTPPMGPLQVMKDANTLTDMDGYVTVNKQTLQHVNYPNIFALGDCSNVPTSKTAAAVFSQGYVLYKNLLNVMSGMAPEFNYSGYTACPVVTRYGYCMLAEFDFNYTPTETFPFDQRKESKFCYFLKKDILPQVYWLSMKGYWNGPESIQKVLKLRK